MCFQKLSKFLNKIKTLFVLRRGINKKCQKKMREKISQHLLFCSTGVSGGDSSLTKLPLSSEMSVPEYTPLSSQMESILSTDLITLGSPSKLEKGEGRTE